MTLKEPTQSKGKEAAGTGNVEVHDAKVIIQVT